MDSGNKGDALCGITEEQKAFTSAQRAIVKTFIVAITIQYHLNLTAWFVAVGTIHPLFWDRNGEYIIFNTLLLVIPIVALVFMLLVVLCKFGCRIRSTSSKIWWSMGLMHIVCCATCTVFCICMFIAENRSNMRPSVFKSFVEIGGLVFFGVYLLLAVMGVTFVILREKCCLGPVEYQAIRLDI